ncbi:MAG TPA: hypothetical protein VKY57_01350 [Chitinispirillaceae bacterium]|nr:hypothetical protein [Chitinispirillaceae bacterium]
MQLYDYDNEQRQRTTTTNNEQRQRQRQRQRKTIVVFFPHSPFIIHNSPLPYDFHSHKTFSHDAMQLIVNLSPFW